MATLDDWANTGGETIEAPISTQDSVAKSFDNVGAVGFNLVEINQTGIPTIDNTGDLFRPFNRGIIEYDDEASTIVLVSKKENKGATDAGSKNYLTQFSSSVSKAIKITPDENYIAAKNGQPIILSNFSIVDYQESSEEIVKITQSFSRQWNAFFFGSRPKVYTFTGILIDAVNYPYYEQFMTMYDSDLAGSKCAENQYRLYMTYDSKIISGWMLNMRISGSAANKSGKGFSFSVLVDGGGFYRKDYGN